MSDSVVLGQRRAAQRVAAAALAAVGEGPVTDDAVTEAVRAASKKMSEESVPPAVAESSAPAPAVAVE